MKEIKYSYCLDENNELVHIDSVTEENRHSHTYHCLECGQPMIAKIGKVKIKHFAHKIDTACNGESYLHKLAKRRIRGKFMSADSFPLTFTRNVPCCKLNSCPCYNEVCCLVKGTKILSDLKLYNGHKVYDNCQEEVTVGEFRPDLLLSGPMDDKLGKVFIEIYKTHESEEPKVNSGNKMIETKKIKNEADIDDIINRGFIEGENCKTYNFSPRLPSIRKSDIPITRFVLFESGAVKVLSATEYIVMCDKLSQRVYPQSVRELNLKASGIDIWGISEEGGKLDSYQTGLVYLNKKGLDIKNCILCKFYKYNEWQNKHVCIRYKTLGEQYHFPKQPSARNCPLYEINPELMHHSLEELEKEVSEV